MKKYPKVLLFLILSVFLCSGSVFAYTIDDNTLVQTYRGTSPYTYYSSQWVDRVGDSTFEVFGIDVSFSAGNITFDMYTNFNHDGIYTLSGQNAYLADLALDLDMDGTYEYGIVMLDHSLWTQGPAPSDTTLTTGLYSVASWDDSQDFWASRTGFIYGGMADQTNPHESYVAVGAGSTRLADPVVSPFVVDLSEHEAAHKWSVTIAANDLGWLGGDIGVFWAGMTCSNDAIEGTAPVPEPTTMLLVGAGLIGLAGLGRKRFRKCA